MAKAPRDTAQVIAILLFHGLLALAAMAFLALPSSASPATDQVQQILKASGVQGGLVVQLGCGDGTLTAALRANASFIVHALDADVTAPRQHIQSLGLYGPVSVEKWAGDRLPYTDNVVNLVVADKLGQAPMAEVLRVLAPNGVALLGGQKTVKPRPAELDEWTHFLHGPDNNAVAHDAVSGPPRHLQWLADPGGARHHDVLATISGVVFAGGRMFVIEDEGPTAAILLPARWQLVARDAFNGLLLWKQPVGKWESHLRKFRSGPTHLPRRLVADAQRVFVTLGYGQPVTALDAATGRLVRTYTGTEGADEIVFADNVLYVVRDEPGRAAVWALNADTGQPLWQKAGAEVADIATQTLAVNKQVFAQIGNEVVSWDRATGRQLWRTARGKGKGGGRGDGSLTPTLVACGDVVLSADGNNLIALSAADGHQLWTAPTSAGYQSPVDVFFAKGLVWTGTGARRLDKFVGRDLYTGGTKREFDTGNLKPQWQTALGGKPSAPVMAGGLVFVAVPEAHRVCALDASNGKLAWQFIAGGRVDSPPTIAGGTAIFGCADGYVYCLRAADGGLVWRFRAAPEERRTVVREQLESIWPVHGSVLVRAGQIWFATGRSTFLDGGMRLTRLEAATGKLLGETVLDSRDPKTGKQPMAKTPALKEATLNDVLSSNGQNVFLRQDCFDANGRLVEDKIPHLFSPMGFLDDSWWIRAYFTWSEDFSTAFTGWSVWPGSGHRSPSGQILVCDDKSVYGFSRRVYANQWPVDYNGRDVTEGREYVLFSAAKDPTSARSALSTEPARQSGARQARTKKDGPKGDFASTYTWSHAVPMKVTALALAGKVLFAAGPPDLGPVDLDPLGTWEGKRGGVLAALSAADGKTLGEWKLDALPVWDSLIAADGRLFFSTRDGQIRCFSGNEK